MNPFFWLATANLILGGLVFLLGLLILRENPRQKLNRVVMSMLFFGGLGSILAALTFLESLAQMTADAGTSLHEISRGFRNRVIAT